MNKIILALTLCFIMIITKAQTNPEIGKPMPNFMLTDVRYYAKNQVSLADFKGAWLIMDFFAKTCINCFQSFPKINELKERFEGKVNFLVIGINNRSSYNNGIEEIYEKFRKKQNLKMIVAYDSLLWRQYEISGLPHYIIIDPAGIVRQRVGGANIITEKYISSFLLNGFSEEENGVSSEAEVALIKEKKRVDEDKFYFKSKALADSSLVSFSSLSKFRYTIPTFDDLNSSIIQFSMLSLRDLYRLAYMGERFAPRLLYDSTYGRFWPQPILEISDTNLFQTNYRQKKGYYNYTVMRDSAKTTRKDLFEVMQMDFKRAFGYDVKIETRMMPCLWLVASDSARVNLRTKGETKKNKSDKDGFSLFNAPVNKMLSIIEYGISSGSNPRIFIDKTEINDNIDITLDALLTDFSDIKNELQKKGLDLIEGKKEMKVIVIRDAQTEK